MKNILKAVAFLTVLALTNLTIVLAGPVGNLGG
jgi:hypothetical protein